jgi:hypothetical protein
MARRVVVLASVVAGACWLVALLLPWTDSGALSSASLLDAVELIRRGTVDALVPSPVAALLLVPALAGTVLVGVVGFDGRTAAFVRVAALLLGSLASLGLALRLTELDVGAAGPGAWVALGGVLAAVPATIPALKSLIRPSAGPGRG